MPQMKALKVPKPSSVEAYVIKQTGSIATVEKEQIFFFKPSSWLECLEQQGLTGEILGEVSEFWRGVRPDDPKLWNNPMTKVKGWRDKFQAMLLHGDAGPHQKHDSINTYSIKSLTAPEGVGVFDTYLLLFAVPNACRCTPKKCADLGLPFVEDTLDALGRELVKDFNMLFDAAKLIVWVATADCEHLSKDYGLPNHGNKDAPCMRCGCNKHTIPISDVSPGASWRSKCYTPKQLSENPLTDHWLLKVKGFSHFSWVYDPMHCQEIGSTQHALANVFYDVFYKHLAGRNAP